MVIDIIAENIDNSDEYIKIVENNIQNINNMENKNYNERIINRHKYTDEERDELYYYEDLFKENVSNFEDFTVYRLRYNLKNTSYVVYTLILAPYSIFRFLKIYINID
jgi:hypothetical protein